MNKFNEIISNINNLNNTNMENNEQLYIKQTIESLFIKLNIDDINVLKTLLIYLVVRINKLFIYDDNNFKQFKKNNNQDMKGILLLLLPYINDDKVNVYFKLKDLNELILTKNLSKSDFNLERSVVLNTHFKYTNIGIGLIDTDDEIKLNDEIYQKLIYKIIYHNFMALNETLSIINGKLYVNWVNICPLSEENYKTSNIYINTQNKIDNVINKIISYDLNDLYSYNGLYIGEFYNVYRNIYFESIKKVKWFIFIIKNKYIIQYLNDIFDFKIFLNYISFDYIDTVNEQIFINKLKLNLNEDNLLIWKNILIFFVNSYSLKNIALKNLDKNKINNFILDIEQEGTDYDLYDKQTIKNFNEIDNDTIIYILQNIDAKYIWGFIKESLNIFQSTIYSNYLIKDNKVTTFLNFENSNLNLKNIYNIAKTLSYESLENWELLPIKYSSLDTDKQTNFFIKFKSDNISWIKLRSNIKLEEGRDINNIEYAQILQKKLDKFNEIKYELVWDYLVKNGILTEFQTNFKINDEIEYRTDENRIKQIKIFFDKNIEKYENCYYYLTNKMYKDHLFLSKNNEETTLLKSLIHYKWYLFYAMDWISQIGFYHHYLNHRILYITGATGQGKSTQVPKLFMHSLKMLDYKLNGKVICTQPRIGPTNSNATRIAEELGVTISQYTKLVESKTHVSLSTNSKKLKDNIKDNYYVQLSHSTEKREKKNCNHLTLKIITDGTLLIEIIKNPFLKTEVQNNNDIEYSNKNIYDIIIIDEAHEHNTNMDLILTLVRQSCFINNDIKLVIMSATMDDDEPHFRSYYNIINDNLVYPLREKTKEYFLNNENNNFFLYDSIYLDRRFHIAPPGKTTQYNIAEYYEPDGDVNNIVKTILESSTYGDILIFENGINDIIKRIKILNKITPNNVIALPYYSTLHSNYRSFIEDDLDVKKVKIDKSKVHLLWTERYSKSDDVANNTYNRCIIVATNVAEASITINSLKFVIDNGYAKINSYDYFMDNQELKAEEISESSRKQRKGRVGRVTSGTIYYLYKKGDRENNKPKYKITQENFGPSLIKLLETKSNLNSNLNSMLITLLDPNNYITFNNNKDEILKKVLYRYLIYIDLNNFNDHIFFKKKIYNFIMKQYQHNNYLMYWDDTYYKFMSNIHLEYMYKQNSGFELRLLLDNTGLFYIIHPFEQILKRNIKGNVISYIYNNTEIILKDKLNFKDIKKKSNNLLNDEYFITDDIYSNMLLNLNNKYLLVDFKLENVSFINNKVDIGNFQKTEFVNIINDMDNKLIWREKTQEDIIIILTSIAYGSFNEVLEILTFIKIINKSMANIFINSKIPYEYNSQDIEIEYIYNLIKNFKKSFNYFKIFEIKDYSSIKNKYKNNVNLLVNKFLIDYQNDEINPPKIYSAKLWGKLSNYYNNGLLKTEKVLMGCINDIDNSNNEIYNFRNYNNEIKIWAKNRNINSEILIDYLEYYTNVYIEILTIKKNLNDDDLDPVEQMKNESISFIKSLTMKHDLEHIIRPFLHGNPFNIALKLQTHGSYKTIALINVINTTKPNTENLLYYFGKEIKDNFFNINITNKIEIEWLFNVLPFYYKPSTFKNEIIKKNNDSYKIYSLYGDLYTEFYVKLSNKWSLNNIPFESTQLPILKKYIEKLKKIEY